MTKDRHQGVDIPVEKERMHSQFEKQSSLPRTPRGGSKWDMIEFHANGFTFTVKFGW